jgi:LPXTG-site transpeptidase (sortase) family protein
MRRPLLLVGYLVGMALIGFLALSVPRLVRRHSAVRARPTPIALARTETPTPAPSPTPPPLAQSPYPPDRLVIPSLGINAAWIPLGYLSDGLTMDSPPGPKDLGWYKFTGEPGGPSNAVFSGHVDWYTGEPAIFQNVHSLKQGDEIDVSRDDGRLRVYHVVSTTLYDFQTTDATPIIAPTDVPTVTLITCEGTFNPVTHEYNNRLVVVATAPPGD